MLEARRHGLGLVLWSAWGREWDEPDSISVASSRGAGVGPGGIVLAPRCRRAVAVRIVAARHETLSVLSPRFSTGKVLSRAHA